MKGRFAELNIPLRHKAMVINTIQRCVRIIQRSGAIPLDVLKDDMKTNNLTVLLSGTMGAHRWKITEELTNSPVMTFQS